MKRAISRSQRGPVRGMSMAFALGLCLAPLAAWGQDVPPGFVDEPAFTGLVKPTVVRFSVDGRVFVAEKRGVVRVFDSLADASPETFVDIRDQVHDYWDRGLLGMALHPDFDREPYVYLLYSLDARPGEAPPSWGDQCPDPPGGTQHGCVIEGRLSRFRASGNQAVGTEQVLLQNWCQQFPSHSVGALAFGDDGALYATGGDGASFNIVDYGQRGDPLNPCGDPPAAIGALQETPGAEGGALRSQDLRTMGDPVSLSGTLLRLDPVTGAGLPDNPLHGGATATDDGIIAYGLRNPFRFALRPRTDEIWVGDVGWRDWEEINVVASGRDATVENFGWPCFEGDSAQSGYDSANLALCENLYAAPAAHARPVFTYHHDDPVARGDGCGVGDSSVTGLAFYGGSSFPEAYRGALFFADYARDCIWAMLPAADGAPNPHERRVFSRGALGPIDLVEGPDEALYYVSLRTDSVRRIRYVGPAPIARIIATPTRGPVPLDVEFDGSRSSDPGGAPLRFDWDLDDDGDLDSTEPTLTHRFEAEGRQIVRLRVTNSLGLIDDEAVAIDVANTPPVPRIESPLASLRWRVGDRIAFEGTAQDPEEGPLPESALSWEIVVLHCSGAGSCHEHGIVGLSGTAFGSFSAPDHDYPSHLLVRFRARDSSGLEATTEVEIFPETGFIEVVTLPSGLSVAVGGQARPAPFSVEAIVGSVQTVSAPSPQEVGGARYVFDTWSDLGAETHLVTVPWGSFPLSAQFKLECEAECSDASMAHDAEFADGGAARSDAAHAEASDVRARDSRVPRDAATHSSAMTDAGGLDAGPSTPIRFRGGCGCELAEPVTGDPRAGFWLGGSLALGLRRRRTRQLQRA